MHFIQIGDWLFDVQSQRLLKNDTEEKLEPISSDLLLYLANNQGQIIAKDDLIEYVWRGRVVSDSAITRVISMLRRHLDDDPVKPKYIRTVQKQGYVLFADCKAIDAADTAITSTRKTSYFMPRNVVISTVSLVLLMLVFTFVTNQETSTTTQIMPIVSNLGQQRDITVSSDEKWLIYSHKAENSKFYNLYIKNLVSGKINQLTSSEADDVGSGISIDNSSIYFARIKKGRSCAIMHIDLTDFSGHKEEEVVQCGYPLAHNNVSVHPNGMDLFFRAKHKEALGVYRYNLKTKTYRKVTNLDSRKVYDWRLNISPDGNTIAIFRRVNSVTQLLVKDLATDAEERLLWSGINIIGDSISWSRDSRSVFVRDVKYNRIVNIDITTRHLTPIELNAQLLTSLSNQTVSGAIYASYGLNSRFDMFSVQLQNPLSKRALVDSSANESIAVQLHQDEMLFTSDRTGINQFYIQDKDGDELQLTQFDEYMRFDSISAHPVNNTIIGMTNARLFTYDIDRRLFFWLTEADTNLSAPFYNSQGDIFYFDQRDLYRFEPKQDHQLILKDVGLTAQWLTNSAGEEELLYHQTDGSIYRHNFKSNRTTQVTTNIPHREYRNRMWIGTEAGIYFVRSEHLSDRGLYFKEYGSATPSLVFSSGPDRWYHPHLDLYNMRMLMRIKEENLTTKIVKFDVMP